MVAAKSVRFNLSRNTERTFDVPDDIPHDDLWFTQSEFDAIKQYSRSESREWRKIYSHLLHDTFEHARYDAQDYLTAFCLMQGDLYRRGLERQCNRHHGEQRSDAKDRTRYLVLESQRRLANCKNRETELAELYAESCRHARLFAHRIAKADEIVALGKMECAARTQGLVVPKVKRRSSGMSTQSMDSASYDSRMQFLHRRQFGNRRNSTTKSKTPSPVTIVENAETYAAIA